MSTNEDNDFKDINLSTQSEPTRDDVLALWQKLIFERCDVEDYLEHYKEEKALHIFYSWIDEYSPVLAEALNSENKSHVEGILLIGNEALRNIKIGSYARPKRGYFQFTDSQRLNGMALQIQSEEETKRADAKAAAIAKRTDKEILTVEEVLNLDDYVVENEIVNYIVLNKVVNGTPQDFYVKCTLEEGEIVQELTNSRAIPLQTAPSIDFHKQEYVSFKELYTKLHTIIMDYVAFSKNSIYPDLIALGCVASFFREVFYTFPFYDYISSEPESGKTTAMKVQTFLSFYGTIASSITEPLLFREIDGSHCFYGLDNLERVFVSPKDHVALIDWLLSSSSRDIPCKRLEKTEEGYEVRYFDGYGIKAFTHIRDFPFALRALRSRCIQIVMQNAKPAKFYPSAEKFTEIRDKQYKARLWEFEAVKKSYENLINDKILSGRTSDLYLPLLSIAKLVDKKLYQKVLHYAVTDEVDRKELDSWNLVLIQVLLKKELFGSYSTNEIRVHYEEALINVDLLKDTTLHTRTVTTRLKKLGFQREEKKTDNKTWFQIDEKNVMLKAYDYGILDEEELEKNKNTQTPPKANLVTLPNFDEDKDKDKERTTERSEEDKPSTDEIEPDVHEDGEELTKLGKLAKGGVSQNKNNVCDRCGEDTICSLHEGIWICDECLTNYAETAKDGDNIRPEAFDGEFQTRQDKEAVDRRGVASDE